MDPNAVAIAAGSLVANGVLGVFAAFLLRGNAQLQGATHAFVQDQASRIRSQADQIRDLELREASREGKIALLEKEVHDERSAREDCQARLGRLEGLFKVDEE